MSAMKTKQPDIKYDSVNQELRKLLVAHKDDESIKKIISNTTDPELINIIEAAQKGIQVSDKDTELSDLLVEEERMEYTCKPFTAIDFHEVKPDELKVAGESIEVT